MQAHPLIHRNQEPDGSQARPETRRLLALGAILILAGAAAMAARSMDLDLGALIGEQTWPLLVVLPGLALLGLAVVPKPPDGVGFAIAGSIVTTVGLILLVQANTEDWASWAYVWALIPGAAGLGLAGYGLLTRTGELVDKGAGLVVIAGVLYVVGWWYFDALFATGEQPVDVAAWWPVALIAAGAIIAVRALLGSRDRGSNVSNAEGGTSS